MQILQEAMADMASFHPFMPDFFNDIGKDNLRLIDHFIHRFAMLQDLMKAKLFDLVLESAQVQVKYPGFLDKLDTLERMNLLDKASDWEKLRDIRNNFAHEYPDKPGTMAKNLNEAFAGAHILLGILDAIKNFVRRSTATS